MYSSSLICFNRRKLTRERSKLSEDGRCVQLPDFVSMAHVQDLDERTLYIVIIFL
jgi:hypothetical protein